MFGESLSLSELNDFFFFEGDSSANRIDLEAGGC